MTTQPARLLPAPITGRLVVPMIGHPVAQTKLPDAFAARTPPAVVMPRIEVTEPDLTRFVAEVRDRDDIVGFVTTIPHKRRLAGLVDTCEPVVGLTGVCNAARREDGGRLHGDMFDGVGMCDALAAAGVELSDVDAVVVGSGAAGRAIALELVGRGARRVELRDIDPATERSAVAALAAYPRSRGGDRFVPSGTVTGAAVLVNASPAGMYDDTIPFDPAEVGSARAVGDAVTTRRTPLVAAAADRDLVVVDGSAMAAAQLEPLMRLLSLTGEEG